MLVAYGTAGGALILCLLTINKARNFTLPSGLPASGPRPVTTASFYVFLIAVLLGTTGTVWWNALRSLVHKRAESHRCVECGYQLTDVQSTCPECGTSPPDSDR